jgi:hypothetical protein
MKERKRVIHPSAVPLLACIDSGKFTRKEVARRLGLANQANVTNWLARGIPARQIPEVAQLCGLSSEEYLARAGMTRTHPSGKVSTTALMADFEPLPEGVKRYLLRHASDLRSYCESLPQFLLDSIAPPESPEGFSEWAAKLQQEVGQAGSKRRKPRS